MISCVRINSNVLLHEWYYVDFAGFLVLVCVCLLVCACMLVDMHMFMCVLVCNCFI